MTGSPDRDAKAHGGFISGHAPGVHLGAQRMRSVEQYGPETLPVAGRGVTCDCV
jgi:hypothetical protein